MSIPFRREDGDLGASLVDVLLILVVLLGAAAVGLWFAKRRGWLRTWTTTPPTEAANAGITVLQRLRLSPKTVVYRLKDGDAEFLIVESTANTTLQRR